MVDQVSVSWLKFCYFSSFTLQLTLLLPLLSHDSEKASTASHSACPVVLRRMMLGDEVRICRCSNHQIPYVTDLEYDHIINNQMSSSEQITVVCVTTSLRTADYDPRTDKHLEQLYERKNKNRSMPCTQVGLSGVVSIASVTWFTC